MNTKEKILTALEESRGKWDTLCICGHWFHEHYDGGLGREGCCFYDCLHLFKNGKFCRCEHFKEIINITDINKK